MTTVFLLYHIGGDPDDDSDVRLLGVYSSRDLAEAAADRLGKVPGLSGKPEEFQIDQIQLDRDHWTEGFVTVRHPI